MRSLWKQSRLWVRKGCYGEGAKPGPCSLGPSLLVWLQPLRLMEAPPGSVNAFPQRSSDLNFLCLARCSILSVENLAWHIIGLQLELLNEGGDEQTRLGRQIQAPRRVGSSF